MKIVMLATFCLLSLKRSTSSAVGFVLAFFCHLPIWSIVVRTFYAAHSLSCYFVALMSFVASTSTLVGFYLHCIEYFALPCNLICISCSWTVFASFFFLLALSSWFDKWVCYAISYTYTSIFICAFSAARISCAFFVATLVDLHATIYFRIPNNQLPLLWDFCNVEKSVGKF